jgi:hypothetical protein
VSRALTSANLDLGAHLPASYTTSIAAASGLVPAVQHIGAVVDLLGSGGGGR